MKVVIWGLKWQGYVNELDLTVLKGNIEMKKRGEKRKNDKEK